MKQFLSNIDQSFINLINSNNNWKNYEYLQNNTSPESPIYLDFRFGNVCNFRCRTCGPMASTSWIKEFKEFEKKLKI